MDEAYKVAQQQLDGLLKQFPMTGDIENHKPEWKTNMSKLKQANTAWKSKLEMKLKIITDYLSIDNNGGEANTLSYPGSQDVIPNATLNSYFSALKEVMNDVNTQSKGGRRKSRRHRKNRVSRKSKKASRSRKSRSRK